MLLKCDILIWGISINDECLKTQCSRKCLDPNGINEVEKLYYITRNFVIYTRLEIKEIKIGCTSNSKENQEMRPNFDERTSWKIEKKV
jgi:hypothetical protein